MADTNDVAIAALYLGAGIAKHLNRKGLMNEAEAKTMLDDIEAIMAGDPQGPTALAILSDVFLNAR